MQVHAGSDGTLISAGPISDAAVVAVVDIIKEQRGQSQQAAPLSLARVVEQKLQERQVVPVRAPPPAATIVPTVHSTSAEGRIEASRVIDVPARPLPPAQAQAPARSAGPVPHAEVEGVGPAQTTATEAVPPTAAVSAPVQAPRSVLAALEAREVTAPVAPEPGIQIVRLRATPQQEPSSSDQSLAVRKTEPRVTPAQAPTVVLRSALAGQTQKMTVRVDAQTVRELVAARGNLAADQPISIDVTTEAGGPQHILLSAADIDKLPQSGEVTLEAHEEPFVPLHTSETQQTVGANHTPITVEFRPDESATLLAHRDATYYMARSVQDNTWKQVLLSPDDLAKIEANKSALVRFVAFAPNHNRFVVPSERQTRLPTIWNLTRAGFDRQLKENRDRLAGLGQAAEQIPDVAAKQALLEAVRVRRQELERFAQSVDKATEAVEAASRHVDQVAQGIGQTVARSPGFNDLRLLWSLEDATARGLQLAESFNRKLEPLAQQERAEIQNLKAALIAATRSKPLELQSDVDLVTKTITLRLTPADATELLASCRASTEQCTYRTRPPNIQADIVLSAADRSKLANLLAIEPEIIKLEAHIMEGTTVFYESDVAAHTPKVTVFVDPDELERTPTPPKKGYRVVDFETEGGKERHIVLSRNDFGVAERASTVPWVQVKAHLAIPIYVSNFAPGPVATIMFVPTAEIQKMLVHLSEHPTDVHPISGFSLERYVPMDHFPKLSQFHPDYTTGMDPQLKHTTEPMTFALSQQDAVFLKERLEDPATGVYIVQYRPLPVFVSDLHLSTPQLGFLLDVNQLSDLLAGCPAQGVECEYTTKPPAIQAQIRLSGADLERLKKPRSAASVRLVAHVTAGTSPSYKSTAVKSTELVTSIVPDTQSRQIASMVMRESWEYDVVAVPSNTVLPGVWHVVLSTDDVAAFDTAIWKDPPPEYTLPDIRLSAHLADPVYKSESGSVVAFVPADELGKTLDYFGNHKNEESFAVSGFKTSMQPSIDHVLVERYDPEQTRLYFIPGFIPGVDVRLRPTSEKIRLQLSSVDLAELQRNVAGQSVYIFAGEFPVVAPLPATATGTPSVTTHGSSAPIVTGTPTPVLSATPTDLTPPVTLALTPAVTPGTPDVTPAPLGREEPASGQADVLTSATATPASDTTSEPPSSEEDEPETKASTVEPQGKADTAKADKEEKRRQLRPWAELRQDTDKQQRLWNQRVCNYRVDDDDADKREQLACMVAFEDGTTEKKTKKKKKRRKKSCELTDFCRFCSGKTITITAADSATTISVPPEEVFKLRPIDPLADVDDVQIEEATCSIRLKHQLKLEEVQSAMQTDTERLKREERMTKFAV